MHMQMGGAPVPQQDDDQQQQQPAEAQNSNDGTQRITDPQDLYEFFKNADRAAADAMLAQWRAETLDADNRQQDTDTQRFFNYIGWAEQTPEVLTESQYQQSWQQAGKPIQMYHSDNPYGPPGGVTIGARQFAAQYMGNGHDLAGNTYRHFLSGGIHGDGTYFADSASASAPYGTSQFRGFLNDRAKVISESDLDRRFTQDSQKYPELARVINSLSTGYGNGYSGARSVYAAMLGYNVIDASYHSGYYAVLNRGVTTISSKTRKSSYGMANW
jgi:hypothetical protein